MKSTGSNGLVELDADHGDIDPRSGAGLGGFVIVDQTPLAHQLNGGVFQDPATQQDFEDYGKVVLFDYRIGVASRRLVERSQINKQWDFKP